MSFNERQRHLNLQSKCIERGGNSTIHKGVLSQFLNAEIPNGRNKGSLILCHACRNSKCSNPRHLYFGTHQDNFNDEVDRPNFWQRVVNKYGYEEACKRNKFGNKSKGGKANKGKPKSKKHKDNISCSLKRVNKD